MNNNYYEKKWLERYILAKQYYEEHGNLLIPVSYIVNGIKMGRWIGQQRKTYKRGIISQERINLLERIGMVWYTQKEEITNNLKTIGLEYQDNLSEDDNSWNFHYQLAAKYYQEHNNLLIPQNYKVNGVNLGAWISSQRLHYKKETLSKEHINLLESIGMVWRLRLKVIEVKNIDTNLRTYTWNYNYQLAKQYYQEHGNLSISQNYVINGIRLGNWVCNQRSFYKRGTLSEERIKLLEDIGIVWRRPLKVVNVKPAKEDKWLRNYNLASSYYKEHGNLLIQRNYSVNDINLGAWINNQRFYYLKNKLSADKIALLETIGMVWNVYKLNEKTTCKKLTLSKNN